MEDNLGRPGQMVQVIQVVQDGWNRPWRQCKDTPNGFSDQKYALLVFEFYRAYATVDHRLLEPAS